MPPRREHPFFIRNGFWYGYTDRLSGKRPKVCLDVRAKGREDDWGCPEISPKEIIKLQKILDRKVEEILFKSEETRIDDALGPSSQI